MTTTRRAFLSGIAGVAGAGTLAGCVGDSSSSGSSGSVTSAASFFVFGDIASQVAGTTAENELLVPIGQHGHGWQPGPQIREEIRNASLLIHGMNNFQPWVDDIKADLEADGAGVTTVDASTDVTLLEAGGSGHDGEHDNEDGQSETNEHDHSSGMDPHFWMDPLRVKDAVDTVRQGFADEDPDNAETYADNAESFQESLDELHEQTAEMIDNASKNVVLVAGHDSFQYFADRYGIEVASLTNVSPDDRATPRDIKQAQKIIETHDIEYICTDPLSSQQAAEQLVAETDAREVLSLTAMPGLTEEWKRNDWGYIEVMKNVNLPTLERALEV